MSKRGFFASCHRGFTLTELAIVLVIISLLVGGVLAPIAVQRDIRDSTETQKQLTEIKEALLGFAVANGRLPCPAAPDTTGIEAHAAGVCSNAWDGFLPAITLGVQPTDAQGYAIDSWNNRIRYAVTKQNENAFTTIDGMKSKWTHLTPNLSICTTAAAITGTGGSATCASVSRLADSAPAIVFSTGKNGATAPTSADELANWTSSNDPVFVSATPGKDFDDLVIWLSPNILYSRMLTAGRLP